MPLNVFSLWVISLHVIVCLTPATLLALANYHTLKVRATANVINLKARKQYNAALSKSKANKSKISSTTSKIRKPRHIPLIKEGEDLPPGDRLPPGDHLSPGDHTFKGNNTMFSDLVDDSFMMNERTPEERLDSGSVNTFLDEETPHHSLEAYDHQMQTVPENRDVEYLLRTPSYADHYDIKTPL